MRELLRDMPVGVPDDCLLARIRGRRAFLVKEWDPLLLSPGQLAALPAAPWRPEMPSGHAGRIWRALQREYAWVWGCMEETLRRAVLPLFWLAEVRTLAIWLRRRTGGRDSGEDLLEGSLLTDGLKRKLRGATGVAAAVELLAKALVASEPAFARLPETYRRGGTGAVEETLTDISLQRFAAVPHHPVMDRFVSLLIDGRNLASLAKQLRWHLPSLLPFLPGGSIRLSTLEGLFARRDAAGTAQLAARLAGGEGGGEGGAVERWVREAQGRALHRMVRQPDVVAAVIDYLWRCGNEGRNLGLLARLPVAGSAAVGTEICR